MSYFIGTVLTRLHSGYRSLAMRSLLTLPVDHLTAPAPHLDYFLLASGKERAKKKENVVSHISENQVYFSILDNQS